MWEDHFYPEVIDPATGRVLPDGELGELVVTTLTKEALPMVRYRTRDLTRLLPGTARPMRRMEKVTGRSDDMVILRGVNLFPSQIEELILRVPGLSPHFQLVLARPRRLDELTVRVESRRRRRRGRAARRARGAPPVARQGGDRRQRRGGRLQPDLLERSAGKAQRLVDLRRPG